MRKGVNYLLNNLIKNNSQLYIYVKNRKPQKKYRYSRRK